MTNKTKKIVLSLLIISSISIVYGCKPQPKHNDADIEYVERMKPVWDETVEKMEQLRKEGKRYSADYMSLSEMASLLHASFKSGSPNHPYTAQMIDLMPELSYLAGLKYIDFTAVDLAGNSVRLSERIAGKPAVLHLWGSWCSPCRKKGMEMIPLYEEFRDKGFVMIGVALEKNISQAEAAIKVDEYPWENLVELNDAENIRFKYGMGNLGMCHFLIDEDGTIVAVAPPIDRIRSYLLGKL